MTDKSKLAFRELERSITAALETYSNVHRGTGHHSMVSTRLYEQSREQVLDYLDLPPEKYTVIFCSPRRTEKFTGILKPGSFRVITGEETGLPLGVQAVAVQKKHLPEGTPLESGGGTARLMASGWVIWDKAPDKFEAGTPAIINVIAFAKALTLLKSSGPGLFHMEDKEKCAVADILYRDETDGLTGKELLDKLRATRIGIDTQVPTTAGWTRYVNLDNSASTPTFTPVWDAVRRTWRLAPETHRELIAEVGKICAGMLHAPPDTYDVIFTSNTTEAINLAADNLKRDPDTGTETVIVSSLLEHSSNDLPWRQVTPHPLIRLNIDKEGFPDLIQLEKVLAEYNRDRIHGNQRIKLVAISGASNVLGVCSDPEAIGRIVHRYGARLLVDAAQLVAHRQVDISGCDIDYLAFSAHKVYAPFGSGALIVRKALLNFNQQEMEAILKSGEENPGGIAALGKIFHLMGRIGMEVIIREEQVLHHHALSELSKIKGFKGFGIKDPDAPSFSRKAGVIVFDFKNMFSNKLAQELAIRGGIGVRFGCHCAHILIKKLVGVGPFFERFQWLIATLFTSVRFPGLTRVSLGMENSREDVDTLVRVLNEIGNGSQPDKTRSGSNERNGELTREKVTLRIEKYVNEASLRVFTDMRQVTC